MSADILMITCFRLEYLDIYWENESLSRLESDDILLPKPNAPIISTFHRTLIC